MKPRRVTIVVAALLALAVICGQVINWQGSTAQMLTSSPRLFLMHIGTYLQPEKFSAGFRVFLEKMSLGK